ncbi:MAG: respiratory nitrate reductase subunit gamma [Desulfobacterales bacterium]|jgi:nitrate reductase gamma subunit|nr:respiratory nitrate reductase subunit gamma [Desulfobacterales bacterium]
MDELYRWATGPLVWLAFIVFIGGSLFRLTRLLLLVHRKEKFIYSYMSLKFSLRSILHWLTPFGTANWRLHPWLTIVTFSFHICLVLTPIFLLAHIVMWDEAWNISWWALPDGLAIVTTLVVIGGCLFFFIRRRVTPEVAYVTATSDYVILLLTAAPFVTGLIAYFQWFDVRFFTLLHVLAGEAMLVAVPFTRISHMLFAPLTRAYMGSEFGGIRHARDW